MPFCDNDGVCVCVNVSLCDAGYANTGLCTIQIDSTGRLVAIIKKTTTTTVLPYIYYIYIILYLYINII